MLDEFYHVGRMDSLISKITISAGYGFRMAIVMQDIAQLDELYGKNTRVTTVSGSQIKLFIQINDLDTSEFVSEMLGETTQVYKTPVARPGQGIFAPRAWAPHYTPRRLRSPLELREMSARVAILMVNNSRSFELTKIRHYQDQPYRRLLDETKRNPPTLPILEKWQDETLGGVLAPASAATRAADPVDEEASMKVTESESTWKAPAETSRPASKRKTKPKPDIAPDSSPIMVQKAKGPIQAKPRKALTLGAEPPVPSEDSCNVRDVLEASASAQTDVFETMADVTSGLRGNDVRLAANALRELQQAFGDNER